MNDPLEPSNSIQDPAEILVKFGLCLSLLEHHTVDTVKVGLDFRSHFMPVSLQRLSHLALELPNLKANAFSLYSDKLLQRLQ